MPQIPVYCLTGCLGAGKTTVLNQLVSQPECTRHRTALIVNEFGQIGIDAQRLSDAPSPILELTRGSVFCVCVQHDVLELFDRLVRTIQPEQIIVEASGLADPIDLARWFTLRGLDRHLRIVAHACVVDAANFTKVAAFLKSAVSQVSTADGLVINKCDLLDEAGRQRLGEWLSELNPRAKQRMTEHGKLPWSFLAELSHKPPTSDGSGPPAEIVSWSCQVERVDRAVFMTAVHELGDRLLRLKGDVDFGEGIRRVDVVFGSYNEQAGAASQPSGLTAIGWRISPQELCDKFTPAFPQGHRSSTAIVVPGPIARESRP